MQFLNLLFSLFSIDSESPSSIFNQFSFPAVFSKLFIFFISVSMSFSFCCISFNKNIFIIVWEYYVDITDQCMISPIPICDMKQCYLFTTIKRIGNVRIIQNEYFCKNVKKNHRMSVIFKSLQNQDMFLKRNSS